MDYILFTEKYNMKEIFIHISKCKTGSKTICVCVCVCVCNHSDSGFLIMHWLKTYRSVVHAPRGFNPYIHFVKFNTMYFKLMYSVFKLHVGLHKRILIYIIYSFYGRWKVVQGGTSSACVDLYFSNQIGCRSNLIMIIWIV